MLLAPLRWALRIALLFLAVIVLYFAVTFVQVWLTSRQYDPHQAGAILVMGAAQDDCVPTLDLVARLDQALTLYHQGYAHLIMLTGGKQPGDKCTEAESGAMYLEARGVPSADILQAGGNDSYENIADAKSALVAHDARVVLVTTDPFHEDRSMAIASNLGLQPSPTPTQTSPIRGWSTAALFREGDRRGGPRADHRLQPPGVAARRLSRRDGPGDGPAVSRRRGRRRRRGRWRRGGCRLEADAHDGAQPLGGPDADDAGGMPGRPAIAVADDPGRQPVVGIEGARLGDLDAPGRG